MVRKLNSITSQAVEQATGRSWDEWIRFINRQGGAELDHKGLVRLIARQGGIASGWWQQQLSVGYEQATGRRRAGETAGAGFQIGVQGVIPLGRSALWALLTSAEGAGVWLGSGKVSLDLEPGASYATSEGLRGEVRSVKPEHRLRLTWQPEGRQEATTLQLTLSCPRNTAGRTTLRFHHEKLASAAERERLRSHWRKVLGRIAELARAAHPAGSDG